MQIIFKQTEIQITQEDRDTDEGRKTEIQMKEGRQRYR